MTWFKVDDKFHSHRKIVALGADVGALALWTIAGSWSADQLTDGWIPEYMVPRLLPVSKARAFRFALALETVGLWDRGVRGTESGWQFHGWNERGRQPASEQVLADREANAARQAEFRKRREEARNAVTNSVTNGVGNGTPTRPDPTRPLPTEVPTNTSSPAAPDDGSTTRSKPKRTKGDEPVEPERFDRFWKIYPRKVAPLAAVRAWNKAIKNGAETATILAAAEFYALERRMQDPTYTKHPATWLNAACWQDEPDPAYTPPAGAGGFEVARTNGHGRRDDDLGGDAHMERYLARAAAREANGESFL